MRSCAIDKAFGGCVLYVLVQGVVVRKHRLAVFSHGKNRRFLCRQAMLTVSL